MCPFYNNNLRKNGSGELTMPIPRAINEKSRDVETQIAKILKEVEIGRLLKKVCWDI